MNQYHIGQFSGQHEGRSICQVLERDASAEVGKADVFVSWALSMSVPNLLDALESFIAQEGRPVDTKFWVCDFVIQQNNVGLDLPHLGACVAATDSTCLMMVPWHAPEPMRRAYCIKEVLFTQLAEVGGWVMCRGPFPLDHGQATTEAPPPRPQQLSSNLQHLPEPPLRGDGRGAARGVPRRAAQQTR